MAARFEYKVVGQEPVTVVATPRVILEFETTYGDIDESNEKYGTYGATLRVAYVAATKQQGVTDDFETWCDSLEDIDAQD